MHSLRKGESYRLGIFLVGAYQETLGDIHKLFGDTDTADVRLSDAGGCDAGGYSVTRQRRGDTTDVMLDYVGYAARAAPRLPREGRARPAARS